MQIATVATAVQQAKARANCTSATKKCLYAVNTALRRPNLQQRSQNEMRHGDETVRASNTGSLREQVRRQDELVATNVFETESLREGKTEREEVADE